MADDNRVSKELSLEALAQEIARVNARAQRAEAENARLEARLRTVESRAANAFATSADPAQHVGDQEGGGSPQFSRRGAFKVLGVAAVAGTGMALGSVLPSAKPAGAATGDYLQVGDGNEASSTTQLSTTEGHGLLATTADNTARAGLFGIDECTTPGSFGIAGESTYGIAAIGTLLGSGGSVSGEGVRGHDLSGSATSYGVHGISTAGIGVVADSETGVGLLATLSGNGDGAMAGEDSSGQANSYGVYGSSTRGIGVQGTSSGNVGILGTLTGSGSGAIAGEDQTSGSASYGVYGSSNAGYGMRCTSETGIGLYSNLTGNGNGAIYGLDSRPESGAYGVFGSSLHGWGLAGQGGQAPLYLEPASTAGPPAANTGSHRVGEIYVDDLGAVFVCTGASTTSGGKTTAGTWREITAAAPSYNNEHLAGSLGNAGSVNLLKTAIRVFNSAVANSPAAPSRAAGPLTAGTPQTLQITGAKVGALAVPAGAVGVIGTVTVEAPAGNGSIHLYPEGGAVPGTTNLLFATGVSLSNFCVVALNASGQMNIEAVTSNTNATFDVTGFIF